MRILVVDDHDIVRKGICAVLSTDPRFTVCGEAIDGRDAVGKVAALHPDVVVMDVSMPHMDGLAATREIKRLRPSTNVVMISQHESQEMIRQAFSAGACGYVPKSAIATDLLIVVGKIAQDEPIERLAEATATIRQIDPQQIQQRSSSFEEVCRTSENGFGSGVESGNESEFGDLPARLLQSQDEERRRISRELHDGVGQLLAAMSMNLSKLIGSKARLTPHARELLKDNIALVERAAQEIRNMSYLLHPPLLDEVGLESALCCYVDGFSKRSGLSARLQVAPGFGDGLPRDLALSLFRIVQELLTNIHRHSGSPTALVRIIRSPEEISAEITDEGNGIAPELQSKISPEDTSGVGLRGIRERIRQFGGSLKVSSDKCGTRITVVLRTPETVPETGIESRPDGPILKSTGMNDGGPFDSSSCPPCSSEVQGNPARLPAQRAKSGLDFLPANGENSC